MADREYGITLTGEDKASAVLKKIGEAGKSSMSAVSAAAGAAGGAMKAFGAATVVLNQGVEFAKKGMMLFRMAIMDTISKALEYRSANDAAAKSMRDMGSQSEILRARIGDVLIPIMQAFTDSAGSATESIIGWVNANRVLIGTKIVEWVQKLTTVIVSGLVKGVIILTKAWNGWLMLIEVVNAAVTAYWSMLISGVAGAIGALAKLAGFVNKDLGKALSGAGASVAGLGEEFSRSSQESIDETHRIINSQKELEAQVDRIGDAIHENIGVMAVAALDNLKKSTVGATVKTADLVVNIANTNKAIEEQIFTYERLTQSIRNKHDMQSYVELNAAKAIDAQITMEENYQKALQDTIDKQSEQERLAEQFGNVAIGVASAVGDAFAQQAIAMIEGNQTIEESMEKLSVSAIDAILSMVQQAIMGYAAAAAGAAFVSQAFLPVIGPILGAAAAAAAFGLVRGYLTKFEHGGIVRGGVPGVDSVPIIAQDGERVLTPGQTKSFDRFVDRLDSGGSASPRAMPSGAVINFSPKIDMMSKGSQEEERSMLLRLGRSLEEMVRDGQLRLA